MFNRFSSTIGLYLLCCAPLQAAILPFFIKEVNPGDQTGAYGGFARNVTNQPGGPFTTDTAHNSGTLANTWVSYSLAVQATAGEKISAIAANIGGVVGPNSGLNQRWNFNVDSNGFVPTPESTNVSNADSHIVRLGSVVGSSASETNNILGGPPTAPDNADRDYGVGNSLKAQFGFNATEQNALAGQVIKFAYVVIPRGFEPVLGYRVGVSFNHADGTPDPVGVTFSNAGFWEIPPEVNLINIGERELSAGTMVQALSAKFGPLTWGSLTQTMGPPVAIQPTLLADGTFTWNPAGSTAGKKSSGNVVYQWSAVASNTWGASALGAAFRVTLIPEPATILLLGLSTLTLFGVVRKRSDVAAGGRPNA